MFYVKGVISVCVECPKKFVRDLKSIFPKIDPKETSIIPTCQRTFLDLTNWGDEVEDEKETLLKTVEYFEWL